MSWAGPLFQVWEVETGRLVLEESLYETAPNPDFHPGRPVIAAGNTRGVVELIDFESGLRWSPHSTNNHPAYVRFRPDGGQLAVAERNPPNVEIFDTGSGIREELINKIFQPFFTTKPKGTGLGLAISRQMIEQHDGTITVANRPGGGVLFTILLPVKAEGASA